MTAPNLLSLPLELRFEIYGYLTPFYCYITECVGLALCCKQVYNEYKAEIRLQMKSIHDRINKEWPTISEHPLYITSGKTINNMRRMAVLLPRTMYSQYVDDTLGIPSCLQPIFFLYLDHLDFGLDDSGSWMSAMSYIMKFGKDHWPPELTYDLTNLLCPLEKDHPAVQAKTLSFLLGDEIPHIPTLRQASMWRGICRGSNYRSSVDGRGHVHLRPKTEVERREDRASSAKIIRALVACNP